MLKIEQIDPSVTPENPKRTIELIVKTQSKILISVSEDGSICVQSDTIAEPMCALHGQGFA